MKKQTIDMLRRIEEIQLERRKNWNDAGVIDPLKEIRHRLEIKRIAETLATSRP